jgi:CRP-like cAMP-binding protein
VFRAILSRIDRQGQPHGSIRRFARKQVVLREGEVPEGLYCIRSGLLKRSIGDPHGNRKILDILGPGDLLGVESITGNGCRAAEAVTLEASELCFLHRRDLPEMARRAPGFALALAAYAAERMATAERGMAELSLNGARERLAAAILNLGRRYGKRTPKGILLDLPISRGELADLVGIALATTSRLLHELKVAGVIRTRGRRILIMRTERLRKDNGHTLDENPDGE